VWPAFTGIRLRLNRRLSWRRQWAFGFHIMRETSWPIKGLNFSRRALLHGLCPGYFICDGIQDLLQCCFFSYLSVKLGGAKSGTVQTGDWGCFRTKLWGEYLDPGQRSYEK
jgi:hypothetical protein